MTRLEFLRDRFGGSNWVIAARKTEALQRRYGADVVVVTKKRYADVEREWRALHGDPYDTVRAEMYLALKEARRHVDSRGALAARIDAALTAEANAR